MRYFLTSMVFFFLCMLLLRVLHILQERLKLDSLYFNGICILLGGVAYIALKYLTGGTIDIVTAFCLVLGAVLLYDAI